MTEKNELNIQTINKEIIEKLEDIHFATDMEDLAPLRGIRCASPCKKDEIDW